MDTFIHTNIINYLVWQYTNNICNIRATLATGCSFWAIFSHTNSHAPFFLTTVPSSEDKRNKMTHNRGHKEDCQNKCQNLSDKLWDARETNCTWNSRIGQIAGCSAVNNMDLLLYEAWHKGLPQNGTRRLWRLPSYQWAQLPVTLFEHILPAETRWASHLYPKTCLRKNMWIKNYKAISNIKKN